MQTRPRLLTMNSNKTLKGAKLGYTTYILYLSPNTQNNKGINLCASASKGCIEACLYQSGGARFTKIQEGRINKSNYFLNSRSEFMLQLHKEIRNIITKHNKIQGAYKLNRKGEISIYKKFCIRLNGTTDIPYDKLKFANGNNIFQEFPQVQFYDYTKNIHAIRRNYIADYSNHYLVFSRSETNQTECLEALSLGYSIAVVFKTKPKQYLKHNVVDGDETDLIFTYPKNSVIGLSYKHASVKGGSDINKQAMLSGFVV